MELSAKLCALLKQAVSDGEIAGANLLILRNGEEIAYAEAGFANIERGEPFRRDTIARIYSMTKPVTAAAVMILVERGLLDLGQPVGGILPSFRKMEVWDRGKRVSAKRDILVKDLLNMTSGLSYPGDDCAGREAAAVFEEIDRKLGTDEALSTMEIANWLGACTLAFQPGEKWMYGTSADVLGAVIEKVSGLRFGDFLQRELFEPLGMTDTGFYVPQEKQHRLADVYERADRGMRLFRTNNLGIRYEQDAAPAFESGGAGLVSTVDDYAKFASMLLGGGRFQGKQVLSKEIVRYLTTGKLQPRQQAYLWESMAGYGYSNLMRIMEEPGMALSHTWKGEYGWDGWLGTYFCNSPQNGITILLFCQRRDAGTLELTRKIRNVVGTNL